MTTSHLYKTATLHRHNAISLTDFQIISRYSKHFQYTVGEHIEAAFTAPEVQRADESASPEKQHITDMIQLQALFNAWGVKLERCNKLGGYLVKGNGDDAFFLTEPTIENIIVLRKAKVEKSRIKKVLENAGVDFAMLTQIETPVTPETQLQKTIFEAVKEALAVEVVG